MLTSSSAAIEVDSGTFAASGLVSGSYAFSKTGSGTLALSDSSNSYSGGTTVSPACSKRTPPAIWAAALTMGSGTLDATSGFSWTNSISLTGGTATIEVDSGTLTARAVSGGGTLTIAGAGTFALAGTDTLGATVTVNSGATLDVTGACTNDAPVNNYGTLTVAGTLSDAFTIINWYNASMYLTGTCSLVVGNSQLSNYGYLEIDGLLTNSGAGEFFNEGGGVLNNTASGTITSGYSFVNYGTFTDSGALRINNIAPYQGVFTNAGQMTVAAGGSFTSIAGPQLGNSGTLTIAASGQMSVAGVLTGNLVDNGSLVLDRSTRTMPGV